VMLLTVFIVGMECGSVIHRNGTQGMRVGDSLQWHAWHADA